MLRDDLYRPWFIDEKWGVEILSGDFLGLVVEITKLEFSDKIDNSVDLEYNVIHKPEDLNEEAVKGPMFTNTMELVVNDILREAVEIAKNEQSTRNNDSQESST